MRADLHAGSQGIPPARSHLGCRGKRRDRTWEADRSRSIPRGIPWHPVVKPAEKPKCQSLTSWANNVNILITTTRTAVHVERLLRQCDSARTWVSIAMIHNLASCTRQFAAAAVATAVIVQTQSLETIRYAPTTDPFGTIYCLAHWIMTTSVSCFISRRIISSN